MKKLILLCLVLASCTTLRMSQTDYHVHRIQGNLESDDEITEMIAPYKEVMEEEMDVVLSYNMGMMEKGKPESTLTNWFVDVIQASTKLYFYQPADFSIQNYGGIRRQSVPQGNLTVGMIYELMPFENLLVILPLTGDMVQNMCNKMSASGGWPVSHNLNFKIQDKKAVDITVNGERLDPIKVYRVAMPDYVANGGDRLGIPKLRKEECGVLLREAVIKQVEATDTLQIIILDGRIKRVVQ